MQWSSYPAPTVHLAEVDISLSVEPAAPPTSSGSSQAAVLAVACMTKRPVCFESWLCHHRLHLSVHTFYVRVEGASDDMKELFSRAPWSSLIKPSFHEAGARDNGVAQTKRQQEHVAASISAARAAGCDWLLHIDDDELLYAPHGMARLHAELARAAECGAASVHALTLEALYESATSADRFREARIFRHRPAEYTSYGNTQVTTEIGCCTAGKSFGNLSLPGLVPDGPHHFTVRDGPSASMGELSGTWLLPPSVAVCLHYESPTLDAWERKFADSGRARRDTRRRMTEWVLRETAGKPDLRDRALAQLRQPPAMVSSFYVRSEAANLAVVEAQERGDDHATAHARTAARCVWEGAKLLECQGLELEIAPSPLGAPAFLRRDLGLTIMSPFAGGLEDYPDSPAAAVQDTMAPSEDVDNDGGSGTWMV
mmetsp:Transcript_46761/g.77432  ORF Transcript_46761/g.77432 Transcript_46761/m.77432 type:complete len:427 (+) Transcript_46761:232-1512(+)